jgi:histidyl-tRNA synthetase
MGDVTARNFVESRNPKMLEQFSNTDISIVVDAKNRVDDADKIAKYLRNTGKNVEVDYSFRKIDRQIKSAEKKGIKTVLVVEERGIMNNTVQIKDLEKNEQKEISIDALEEYFF